MPKADVLIRGSLVFVTGQRRLETLLYKVIFYVTPAKLLFFGGGEF